MKSKQPKAVPATVLPTFVVVGVTKGGTTSLFRYLGQHPSFCPSDQKELRYFSPARYGEELEPIETYARHFAHRSDQAIAFEATPGYFYGGRALATAMDNSLPDVRAVVSLREPGARCWSWYTFVRSRARVPKSMSFDDYLDVCLRLHGTGEDGLRENQPFWGVGGGCYDVWVRDWLDTLGDRFRVMFFDDLVENPARQVRSLCDWLGVDSAPVDDIRFDVENKTEQYRFRRVQQAALAVNRRAETWWSAHPTVKQHVRSAYYTVNRDAAQPQFSERARARLSEFYAEHNRALARALADQPIKLPAWLG